MLRDKVIAIYCLIDDVLKAIGHQTASGCRASDAAILTTAYVAALLLKGNQSAAIHYMRSHTMAPDLPLKSGFTKRLHKLNSLIHQLFECLGSVLKELNCTGNYILDSFPMPVCHNIRIRRCRLLRGAQWRGKCVSKRQYFYGIKIQVITTEGGVPVEVCFVPGAEHDAVALRRLHWDFPAGSTIYDDSGYTNYDFEDLALDAGSISIRTARKSNSKRKDEPWMVFLKNHYRKRIETAFSGVIDQMPRVMHAVTPQGFFLKALLFVAAAQINHFI
jgi:hypothetical protein